MQLNGNLISLLHARRHVLDHRPVNVKRVVAGSKGLNFRLFINYTAWISISIEGQLILI